MNEEGFNHTTIHSLDAGVFSASYMDQIDNQRSESKISFLAESGCIDHIDVLISNFYSPNGFMQNQDAVFSLSKSTAKKLRDYLDRALVTMK